MITIFGGQTSRSIRVVWLMEEMGLPYRVRQVDMFKANEDAEFLEANPAVYIPVLRDGDITMVESIAMLQYLMGRYGPTPLQPAPSDPNFATYLQFLHLGEAGIATLLMTPTVSAFLAPPAERDNWGSRQSLQWAKNRLKLVSAQLARSPFIAGEAFTAADISVTYALEFGKRQKLIQLGETEQAYIDRTMGREAFKRAMARSHEGV